MQSILENPTIEEGELLPDEVLALEEQKKLQILEKLEQFGLVMGKKRDEAVNFRRNSGIEQEWSEDIDAYSGLDEANKKEKDGGWEKPNSIDGVLTSTPRQSDVRSTVFLNITRPYTDAAAAKIADMLLPTDDRNWSIKPTPMPELSEMVKSALATPTPMSAPPVASPPGSASAPNMGAMSPNMGPAPGMPPVPQDPMAVQVQQAMAVLNEADKRAEKAQTQIEDWLVECQYHAEIRKVIEDAAKLGTGILKGPFPVKRKRKSFKTEGGMAALEIVEEIKPGCRRIDPLNFYPDPSCGEDIRNGNGVWERDYISARKLKELIGLPGYVESQIIKVLEEGPQRKAADGFRDRREYSDKDLFEIWYWTGFAEKEDLETINVEVPEGQLPTIPALLTIVNDCVIKGALNPLESGDFPYHVMPWQRRPNMIWGVGVCRQVRTPQRMLNAATRAMMDNAGMSAGPQVVVKRGAIEPADKNWAITPRKIWYVKNEADVASVRDAFQVYSIETRQAELMNIIQFAMKLSEDTTGLPMILQGQQGQAPDTVGGMQLLSNNASSVLRRLARTFDDTITEPFIRQMYEWLMVNSDNDEAKGDFIIDARGSTSLVERDIQNTEIAQMGQLVMNPAFGLSPDKWIKEYLRSRRFDPKKFEMTDEEKAKMQQQQQPVAPQVQAAQIRAQVEMQKAQMDNQTEQMKIKRDTDRDTIFVQSEAERTRNEFMSRREELMVRRELELIKYANQQKMTLEQVKADLASTAMKLRTQKELAVGQARIDLHKHHTPQVATPAVEVPGRAPNGEAFQR